MLSATARAMGANSSRSERAIELERLEKYLRKMLAQFDARHYAIFQEGSEEMNDAQRGSRLDRLIDLGQIRLTSEERRMVKHRILSRIPPLHNLEREAFSGLLEIEDNQTTKVSYLLYCLFKK